MSTLTKNPHAIVADLDGRTVADLPKADLVILAEYAVRDIQRQVEGLSRRTAAIDMATRQVAAVQRDEAVTSKARAKAIEYARERWVPMLNEVIGLPDGRRLKIGDATKTDLVVYVEMLERQQRGLQQSIKLTTDAISTLDALHATTLNEVLS